MVAIIEKKEPYQVLVQRIKNLGAIEEIVTDRKKIIDIISDDSDRHLLCAFFDEINEAIKSGKINPDKDLKLFRDGTVMDLIIHLENTVMMSSYPRKLFQSERLDKINYLSLIEDEQTLAVSYTHPHIIAALCGMYFNGNSRDLTWWRDSGTFIYLPEKVKSLIILEVLVESPKRATELLQKASAGVKSYTQIRQ